MPSGGGRGPVGHDQHADGGPGRLAAHAQGPPRRPAPRRGPASTTCSEDARVGLGQDAVAQVEDVAGGVAGRGRGPRGSRPRPPPRCPGTWPGSRLPWTASPGPDPAPGLVERHPPVDPDHGAPGRGHRGQQLAGAHAEQDGGHARVGVGQLGEQPAGGGQDQLAVVAGGEDAGPAVEDLHGGGTGVQLGAQRGQGQVAEPLDQLVPDGRVAVHEGLHPGEVLGRAALHQVAGHGEGPAGESDERDLELVGQQRSPRRSRRACRRSGSSGRSRCEVVRGPGTARPPPARSPGPRRPRTRWPPPAPRCRRRRWRHRSRSGPPAGGSARPPARAGRWRRGCCPVPRAARYSGSDRPGLAHEPDRDVVDGQAAAGPDEGRVVEPGRSGAAHVEGLVRPQRDGGRVGAAGRVRATAQRLVPGPAWPSGGGPAVSAMARV